MIYNPAKHNKWGTNVAYKLVPETNVLPLVSPDATIVKRAPFLQKHFWVTRSDPSLKYPAGDYPNQAKHEGNGLTNWVNGDRSIDNTDIVVWYNFGVHHIPTPEEWPIMSGVRHGFFLKPCGFFNENPAMYIAPQPCTTKGSAPLIPSKQPPNVETIKPTKPPVHHARL
jgi:primary-amine oxidase